MKTSFIRLHRPDGVHLDSHRAIRLFAPYFRHVKLDRARGLEDFKAEAIALAPLHQEAIFRDTHRLENCRTVWVELADEDLPPLACFMLRPGREIRIEFAKYTADADLLRLRTVVHKLATLLAYDVQDDSLEQEIERKRSRNWRTDNVNEQTAIELGLNAPSVGGDSLLRFSIWFRPHANPPDLLEPFRRALDEYLATTGYDFAVVDMPGEWTLRGYLRGVERPLVDDDCEALVAWAQQQRISCRVLIGELEEEVDARDLFAHCEIQCSEVRNLTPADEAVAKQCREAAGVYERDTDRAAAKRAEPEYPGVENMRQLVALRAYPRERELRLYCCACVRRVLPVLVGIPPAVLAVELAEAYVEGLADAAALPLAAEAVHDARTSDESYGVINGAHAAAWCCAPAVDAFSIARSVSVGSAYAAGEYGRRFEEAAHCDLARDIFPELNQPPVAFDMIARPQGAEIEAIARKLYTERLPNGELNPAELAHLRTALEQSGYSDPTVLAHLAADKPHVRGCWVVDLILQQRS